MLHKNANQPTKPSFSMEAFGAWIEAQIGTGLTSPIEALYKKSDLDLATFHHNLLAMERTGAISLQTHNSPRNLTDEQKSICIHTEYRGYVYYIMIRDDWQERI